MMTETTQPARLFTLRLWQERLGTEAAEWRGKVQALPEGDAYYFRDWAALISQLEALLAAGDAKQSHSDP